MDSEEETVIAIEISVEEIVIEIENIAVEIVMTTETEIVVAEVAQVPVTEETEGDVATEMTIDSS